jgi:hypothetical protein
MEDYQLKNLRVKQGHGRVIMKKIAAIVRDQYQDKTQCAPSKVDITTWNPDLYTLPKDAQDRKTAHIDKTDKTDKTDNKCHSKIQPSPLHVVGKVPLGTSSWCYVYKATYQSDNKDSDTIQVAVKVRRQEHDCLLAREVYWIQKHNHPNLARYIDSNFHGQFDHWLAMELGECDLKHHIKKLTMKHKHMEWKSKINVAKDVAKALDFLHTRVPPIVHGGVTSSSVILRSDKSCFLSSFRSMHEEKQPCLGTFFDSPPWAAYETWMNFKATEKHTIKADIWGLALILYCLLVEQEPWEDGQLQAHIELMRDGKRPIVPPSALVDCPKGYVSLMEKCWDENPIQRPTAKEVLVALGDCLP